MKSHKQITEKWCRVNKYKTGTYGDENLLSKGVYHFLIASLGGLLRCDPRK